MPRTLKEWHGKTPDTSPPPRVRLRVLLRYASCCAVCWRPICPGVKWECDHIVALINGGENRESNLRPLCSWHAAVKNAADMAEKSMIARKQIKHAGINRKRRTFLTNKNGPFKQKLTGEIIRR